MKIEKLSNKKSVGKGILIGFVICLIFVIIVSLLTSKAKYQNSETVKIVEGKVNYVVPDLNVMAVYLKNDKEYVTSKEIPKSGYVLSSDSYCTVPDNKEQIKEDIEYRDGKVYIGINKKGTKCYIYFNSLADVTLAKLKQESKGKLDDKFTGPSTEETGIYSTFDNDGLSYYYRGAVTNNYVKFANFYWRIIRINGDGTLRLIYDGTALHENGESPEDRQIGTKEYNSSYNDNKFVGFKYEDNSIHGTATASTILGSDSDTTSLYGWYKENIADKGLEKKVDQNGLFCNDRNATTNSSQAWDDWLDPEKNNKQDSTGSATYYGAYMRFVSKSPVTPTLNCENSSDIFSKEKSEKGNKSLTYPVGLITADEVILPEDCMEKQMANITYIQEILSGPCLRLTLAVATRTCSVCFRMAPSTAVTCAARLVYVQS